jgi:2-haloacid dehalogenase
MSTHDSNLPIEALVFDVFGTVVDWRTSLINWLGKFGGQRGLTADWAGLVDDWRAAYQPSMEPIRQGTRPFVTLDVLLRETLDTLLPEHGLAGLGDADRQSVARAWRMLDPWPDSVPGLTRLKRRFVIATLSNGGVGLLVDMARHAGLPWDTVLSADLFQKYKPDPAIYHGAAGLLGRPPGSVMMVAAHGLDLKAAAGCGLRTALVARPTEYGPNQAKMATSKGDWDYAVSSLEELADCLGA